MIPGDIDQPSFDAPDPEPPSSLDPTLNVAEPIEVRKRTRKQAQEKQDRDAVLRDFLSTREGRAEMWSILALCGTFENRSGSSANGAFDPIVAAHNAGQKAIGQALFLTWLARDKEGVMSMLEEHNPVGNAVEEARIGTRKRKTRRAGP